MIREKITIIENPCREVALCEFRSDEFTADFDETRRFSEDVIAQQKMIEQENAYNGKVVFYIVVAAFAGAALFIFLAKLI